MTTAKSIFVWALISFCVACSRRNEPRPVAPPQPSPTPPVQSEPKIEREKDQENKDEKDKENKEKENKENKESEEIAEAKRALENAKDEIQKKDQELQQKEIDQARANAALDLISRTQGPRNQMVQSLKDGETVFILFVASGTSLGKLHGLENEMMILKPNSESPYFHQVKPVADNQYSGEFLVATNSLDKFKILLDYSEKLRPEVKMLFFPVRQVVVRSFVKLIYKDPDPFHVQPIEKVFWVGDSKVANLQGLPRNYVELQNQISQSAVCEQFDLICFRSLIEQGYFRNLADNLSEPPLLFFKRELKQAIRKGSDGIASSIGNYFSPSLRNIQLLNQVWVYYPDSSDLQELSWIRDIGEQAERYTSNGAIYQTPIKFQSDLPKPTTDNQLNFSVAVRQFYDHICSVTTCLDRDG